MFSKTYDMFFWLNNDFYAVRDSKCDVLVGAKYNKVWEFYSAERNKDSGFYEIIPCDFMLIVRIVAKELNEAIEQFEKSMLKVKEPDVTSVQN